MNILFAAGGTAGHINPALSVAEHIRLHHKNATISFIGNKQGMEATLVKKAGFDFYAIDVSGFQRKLSFTNIKRNIASFYKMFTSSAEAHKILLNLKPEIVIGFGGYVSGPVVRKAAKMGIKTAIHEQNAFPGITTKMLCKSVDVVMLAFEEAKNRIKTNRSFVVCGNPVRQSLIDAKRDVARSALGLDDRLMILSTGGSLGARKINEVIADVLRWHANKGLYYHYHAIGKYGMDWMPKLLEEKGINLDKLSNIRITEYINDMDLCLAAADIVVGRAGAITLSELKVAGKAAILIPSPNVAENHQFYNAKSLADAGAAIVIEEKDLTSERLIEELIKLLENPVLLKEMEQNAQKEAIFDANERIYSEIMKLYKA